MPLGDSFGFTDRVTLTVDETISWAAERELNPSVYILITIFFFSKYFKIKYINFLPHFPLPLLHFPCVPPFIAFFSTIVDSHTHIHTCIHISKYINRTFSACIFVYDFKGDQLGLDSQSEARHRGPATMWYRVSTCTSVTELLYSG